jgi:hypothetical protein
MKSQVSLDWWISWFELFLVFSLILCQPQRFSGAYDYQQTGLAEVQI